MEPIAGPFFWVRAKYEILIVIVFIFYRWQSSCTLIYRQIDDNGLLLHRVHQRKRIAGDQDAQNIIQEAYYMSLHQLLQQDARLHE